MTSTSPQTPIAFKIALLNIVVGGVGLISSQLWEANVTGISQVSIGLLLLGAGEYINNPPVNPTAQSNSNLANQPRYFNRKRNVSALGNLLDIGGILMLAAGAASLFF